MTLRHLGAKPCKLTEGLHIDVVESTLYGQLWAPKDLGEYAAVAEGLTFHIENPPGRVAWTIEG